jgi:predicted alpha-1,2-mannosidase
MKMRFKTFYLLMLITNGIFPQNGIGKTDYCKYVDTFIGTGAHGHTYPGASLPFGMVQLSPDTRLEGWDACGGYHYSDSVIYGFSHTHLSGVGVPDYGDILLMPTTGKVQLYRGDPAIPRSGYLSRFRHSTEKSAPGYYSVLLDDYNISIELTVTERVGFHKYIFPATDSANIIVDLQHRDPVIESFIRIVNDREIEGYRRGTNWALDKRLYFVARFSKPFVKYGIAVNDSIAQNINYADGKNIKSFLSFQTEAGEPIYVKVALSAVSCEGARKNLDAELPNWNFEEVKKSSYDKWNSKLSKIEVEGGTEKQKKIFYTSLYHCYLAPNLYMDVDGKYRGMDMQIHTAENFENYTVFSMWDTYRALHPLFTIIEQDKTAQFINTLIRKYEQYGALPMWELAANDTRCMIGYHASSIIADAYIKGITGFDASKAFEAMKNTANIGKRGISYYKEFGFVPSNKNSQSVSKTLEYAYDDWCIAQTARKLNRMNDYETFIKRSQFYKNVFDKSVGFMRGRNSGREWRTPFDPMHLNYDYTEGNSFQYLYVPHDVYGLIGLAGGDKKFIKWLDDLFEIPLTDTLLHEESDVSGLIGQYAHGNEPSHHLAYLYNYAGAPWKTQSMTRRILEEMYLDTPGGLSGNEDCGQMSAWYVLGAIGFYPVAPGMDIYALGSPIFNSIKINLENGKSFVINAADNTSQNIFINGAKLNNSTYNKNYISHSDIMSGSVLDLTLSSLSNKEWGSQTVNCPPSAPGKEAVLIPFITSENRSFFDKFEIELACETEGAKIYYTIDGAEPTENSKLYKKPFTVDKSITLKYKAYKNGLEPSITVVSEIEKAAAIADSFGTAAGIKYKYYEGVFRSIWDFEKETPKSEEIAKNFGLEKRLREEWFAMEFDGFVNIPEDDEYTFYLSSDDGGQLSINGVELFESDGRKEFAFEQHASVHLKKGFNEIKIKYFQCSGNKDLKVQWESAKIRKEELPSSVLFYKK